MKNKNAPSVKISEHIHLKQDARSQKYHYYFRLNGKQHRKSTKTSDLGKAKEVALSAYSHIERRIDFGLSDTVLSFKGLKAKYLKALEGESKYKFHKETLQRHHTPFFETFSDVANIKHADLIAYLEHRKAKSNNRVLPQSINKENAAFNQMMRFAFDHEWITKEIKIKRLSEAKTQNRRAHFTEQEYDELLKVSRKRTSTFKKVTRNGQIGALTTARYWNAALLHDLIIIFANTGLRVDEMKMIKWKDIDWNEKTIKLRNAGKTKSNRTLLVRGYGIPALGRIKRRREEYLLRNNQNLNNDELIQSLPNGKFVRSLKKGFKALLRDAGYKNFAGSYTLTSLRHTYATLRLTAREKRASPYALAKQMGTSVRMIEKHYGHDIVQDYRDQLMG